VGEFVQEFGPVGRAGRDVGVPGPEAAGQKRPQQPGVVRPPGRRFLRPPNPAFTCHEDALHPIVDELGPATHHHLGGQHREPLTLEERPGGDAGLGEQPGEPDPPGLGHHGGQQLPADPAPLVVGRDVHPVDVPVRLQLREPDRAAGLLGHRDESPGEPPEPANRVDVVGRPGRDLRLGVVTTIDAADGVPEQGQEGGRVVRSVRP